MTNNQNVRLYPCKDEELPVMAGFTLSNVRRDQTQFEAYSPRYNDEGLAKYETDIVDVENLVNPKTEIHAKKEITQRLYGNMDTVYDDALRIGGYISMAGDSITITQKEFGLIDLKKKAKAKDAEGVLQYLRLVINNVQKYKDPLAAQGLNEELFKRLTDAVTSISADKQLQYKITNDRKDIVQNNIGTLNDLYSQIQDICRIGKILFRNNLVKKNEYSIRDLKQKVRAAARHNEDDKDNNKQTV